ncbi:ankyrin [Viridothelium virens]|uniref:Ankyrin n=1 Tax=Viridothelium virens TaxID=1048519 RepID=A0A6A6HGR9_VIRVR|nr:ankyrin [Viridothelium virens]
MCRNGETFCGFCLLKHRKLLASQLVRLRMWNDERELGYPGPDPLVVELALLVDGLLGDPAVFRSFGYKELMTRGVLDLDTWRQYQKSNFSRMFDELRTQPADGSLGHTERHAMENIDIDPINTSTDDLTEEGWDESNGLDGSTLDVDPVDATRRYPDEVGEFDDTDVYEFGKVSSQSVEISGDSHNQDRVEEQSPCYAHLRPRFRATEIPELIQPRTTKGAKNCRLECRNVHMSFFPNIRDEDRDEYPRCVSTTFPDIACFSCGLSSVILNDDSYDEAPEDLLSNSIDRELLSVGIASALTRAALYGNCERAERLLAYGADPSGVSFEICGSNRYPPLLAAIVGRKSCMVSFLLSKGASIDILGDCTDNSRWIVVKALLDHGIDPSLLFANAMKLGRQDYKVLSVLAAARVDCNQPDHTWVHELDEVTSSVKKVSEELRKLQHFIERSMRANEEGRTADIIAALDHGLEPSLLLPTALFKGDAELVGLLLETGADPRLLNFRQKLSSAISSDQLLHLLDYALHADSTLFLELLLDQRVQSIVPGESLEKHPLTVAACKGSLTLADWIIRFCDVPACVKDVALKEARMRGNSAIVSRLLRVGTHFLDQDTDMRQTSMDLDWSLAYDEDHQGPPPLLLFNNGLILPGSGSMNQGTGSRRKAARENLVYRYTSAEYALLSAVRQNQFLEVQAILQQAARFEKRCSKVDQTVLNLNAVEEGATPLMESIRAENIRIAKLLIQYGADVNTMLPTGTPLSLAAGLGSEPMIRLILREHGDLHVAILMLRTVCAEIRVQRAISRLNEVALRCQNEPKGYVKSRYEVRLLLLLEFRREHGAMMQATENVKWADKDKLVGRLKALRMQRNGMDFDVFKRWAYSLDQNRERAWNTGLGTMQDLCNGTLPVDLNQKIMLLGLAKSMSTVTQAKNNQRRFEEFFEDLPRWQILFNEENGIGDLHAFEVAVWSIWGVDFSQTSPEQRNEEKWMDFFIPARLTMANLFRAKAIGGTKGRKQIRLRLQMFLTRSMKRFNKNTTFIQATIATAIQMYPMRKKSSGILCVIIKLRIPLNGFS